jgi:hypothetical protein
MGTQLAVAEIIPGYLEKGIPDLGRGSRRMILDYNPVTRAYILRVPRGKEPSPQRLMREYGFDFATPASTAQSPHFLHESRIAQLRLWIVRHPRPRANWRKLLAELPEAGRSTAKPTSGFPTIKS